MTKAELEIELKKLESKLPKDFEFYKNGEKVLIGQYTKSFDNLGYIKITVPLIFPFTIPQTSDVSVESIVMSAVKEAQKDFDNVKLYLEELADKKVGL